MIYIILIFGVLLLLSNKRVAELQTELFFTFFNPESNWVIKAKKIYYPWARVGCYFAGTGFILLSLYIILYERL
jgi:hypothetical protein